MRRLTLASPQQILGCFLLIGFTFAASPPAPAQRDQQALAVAAQSFKAMGGTLPSDSRAVGSYSRVKGSSRDTGSIQILTRNTDQTAEVLTNSAGSTQVVYSRGYASQKDASGATPFDLEESLASNSGMFPLFIVAQAVLNPSSTLVFIGVENVNGVPANHICIGTGGLDPNFSAVLNYGMKELWVAVKTGLPLKMSYQLYEAQGSPPVEIAMFYSRFQAVKGVLYPFSIKENFNGTPYMDISITSVAFETGLSDLDFPLN